jgi:hypothetical protein
VQALCTALFAPIVAAVMRRIDNALGGPKAPRPQPGALAGGRTASSFLGGKGLGRLGGP